MRSSGPPVGYLFADIEGSTERWERAPAQMQRAVARLDALVEELISHHGGVIQDRSGDGVFATFRSGNPLQCALEMQLAMQRQDWSSVGGLDLRIGVHACADDGSGQVDRAVANRGGRIMSSGWGGQIVVSDDAVAGFAAPTDAELLDLGLSRFKGVKEPLRLSSLVHAKLKRTEFPPLRSLLFEGASPEALAGPIFGRTKELGDILSKLTQTRSLTLVGPGGNGKTRLALRTGDEVVASQPVCFVSLENASSALDAATTVASRLGLRLNVGRSADEQIVDYLRDKRILLVLDNAETIAGEAGFVGEWMANCPLLTILATSREPLGFSGEMLKFVPGLSSSPEDDAPALALFVHEARKKDPRFNVTLSDLPVFVEISRIVEGSPLALRLTAEWTPILSLEGILERLRESITFLAPTAADERRQSLRGVFEGVWQLMTPEQRQALARLSVFVEAFELTAALSIAETDLATFLALERKGVVVRASHDRFAMHVMVREFARERLAEDESVEAATRTRHAMFYLEAIRDCMHGASVSTRGAALEQLRLGFLEVRAAWFHAVKVQADALLQSVVEPLCYFLYNRSMMREAAELFAATVTNSELKQHFAGIRANFLVHQGDAEGASAAAASVLTAAAGSALARAHANHALGNLAHMRGDFEAGDAHYETAFLLRESVGDLRGCCYASTSAAALHLVFSRTDSARYHVKRGFRLARQLGDAFGMMASHVYAGDIAAVEGRLEDAKDNYEMSLKLEDAAPHPQFRSVLHRRLGTLFTLSGDPGAALVHHRQAHDLARDVGDQRMRAHALIEIGNDQRLLGDLADAKRSLLQGVRLSMTLGMQPSLARGLLELARIELAAGNIEVAWRLLSALRGSDLGEMQADFDALSEQIAGGDVADLAPMTVRDHLNELIEEAEADTLKL
ncbi:MAG: adenylate/guanylate cyclase domain-containing protein [Hyphomonadaceae bacterium]